MKKDYHNLLYGLLCEQAWQTKSCALFGYPSRQDGVIFPDWGDPLSPTRKWCSSYHNIIIYVSWWPNIFFSRPTCDLLKTWWHHKSINFGDIERESNNVTRFPNSEKFYTHYWLWASFITRITTVSYVNLGQCFRLT